MAGYTSRLQRLFFATGIAANIQKIMDHDQLSCLQCLLNMCECTMQIQMQRNGCQ